MQGFLHRQAQLRAELSDETRRNPGFLDRLTDCSDFCSVLLPVERGSHVPIGLIDPSTRKYDGPSRKCHSGRSLDDQDLRPGNGIAPHDERRSRNGIFACHLPALLRLRQMEKGRQPFGAGPSFPPSVGEWMNYMALTFDALTSASSIASSAFSPCASSASAWFSRA